VKARRVFALARYSVAGNLRTPYTWAGAALFLVLALLGLWGSARAGDGWVVNPSLTLDGALLATVFGIRSGLIVQRTGGLQTYLRMNFVSPGEHLAGATASLLASWLLVCIGLFVLNLVLPGGSLAEAAWQASFFAARTGVLIPFVLVAESTTTIDVPFFLPALLYFGLLAVLVFALGQVEAMAALAPPVRSHDYGSLQPSLARVAGVWAVVFPAVFALGARRS
jgi:hypothetical protein